MFTLIKDVEVFSPEKLGKKDVLICGKQIVAIDDYLSTPLELEANIIDGKGKYLFPGLVDSLVHISGGGGEAGFASRTPEMNIADATLAGITTVVGALGTDNISRTHTDLVAKAKGLKQEGLNVFCHTGSYHTPVQTLTQNINNDIMFIEEFIGVGEVAIADHRGSQLSVEELARIAAQSRTAGILSNKKGTVSIHVGSGESKLDLLFKVAEQTDIPLTQFYPTHMNRNESLLSEGIRFCNASGTIDFTTSTTEYDLANGEIAAAKAVALCIEQGVNPKHLTMSSDGHASLPIYDKKNELIGFEIGDEYSLYQALVETISEHGVDISTALQTVTSNPADILGLNKGRLIAGGDADLLLVNNADFEIDSVWANGTLMVSGGKTLTRGFFSN